MATTKAYELAQFGTDLIVDEAAPTATYNGTILASSGYQNLPTVFTVFGRTSNTEVSVSSGVLTVVGRAQNIEVGIS